MQSYGAVGRRRSGHGPVPAFFCRSRGIPLITPQANLASPRRGVRFTFRQIGLKELSRQPMVLLQPVTTRAVIDGGFPEKQSQDAH